MSLYIVTVMRGGTTVTRVNKSNTPASVRTSITQDSQGIWRMMRAVEARNKEDAKRCGYRDLMAIAPVVLTSLFSEMQEAPA